MPNSFGLFLKTLAALVPTILRENLAVLLSFYGLRKRSTRASVRPLAAADHRKLPAHVRKDLVQLGVVALPSERVFFLHTFFHLHDEGPAGSSYPAGGKPTARMAVASAEAVGSAPLLQRGRAHGLAPGPVAGSRAVARARGCRAPCWSRPAAPLRPEPPTTV